MNKKTKIIFLAIIFILLILVGILGYKLYQKNNEEILVSENMYNKSLYELADYMNNVKNYLAKSTISTSNKHGAETLTSLWREANLAQTYLSMLPIESQELENTEKFLNQVSEYSYSLSRKNINGENLDEQDLKNLENLHKYSTDMCNVILQISSDLNSGNLTWNDLKSDNSAQYAMEVSSNIGISENIEDNFHEYEGLIYDGAYSEHITSMDKKGLTGSDVSEEEAQNIAKKFIGENDVQEMAKYGISENGDIKVYTFSAKTKTHDSVMISVSKKGGHIVYMNANRDVNSEKIEEKDVDEIGKKYLASKGFKNMKETYFLKNNGVITVNYAYEQDGVIIYPDLIKVKIALDNGEILGIETTGYLSNHTNRDLSKIKISKEDAKNTLNKELNIISEGLAIIPTEWKSEILCYEFKGKIEDTEYLVYINAETGEEEDILIITNTPNGTLTM